MAGRGHMWHIELFCLTEMVLSMALITTQRARIPRMVCDCRMCDKIPKVAGNNLTSQNQRLIIRDG